MREETEMAHCETHDCDSCDGPELGCPDALPRVSKESTSGRASALGPFRLDEDEVECSNDKCPQNDGGVCIESREDCNRRVWAIRSDLSSPFGGK